MAGRLGVRAKILGIVLGLAVMLGLVATWQARAVMAKDLVDELDAVGEALAIDLASRVGEPGRPNDSDAVAVMLDAIVMNHPDAIYAFVLDRDGAVLAHTFGAESVPAELLDIYPSTTVGDHGHPRLDFVTGNVHDYQAVIADGQFSSVRLGLSEERLADTVERISRRMLLITVLVGSIGVAAASLLTWLLTRPILDLVHTTDEVGAGDLSARATRLADDEIGSLGRAFNRIVTDLEVNRETIAESEATRANLVEKLIDAQEDERRRIARDLHDTIGQAISSLMVGMASLDRASSDREFADKRNELQQLAKETIDEVRQMGRQLRPSALDDLGLAAALDHYTHDFTVLHPHVSVDLHVDLPNRLAPPVETNLYRIVQEGMTNSARHSSAATISVLLTMRDGLVRAIIEDDGHGFDPVSTRKNGHSVGIHAMKERAELVGGRMTIESGRDGTTVFVVVPV